MLLYTVMYASSISSLLLRMRDAGSEEFYIYSLLLAGTAPLPPAAVAFIAFILRYRTDTRALHPMMSALSISFIKPFNPLFWYFKSWLLAESTVFSMTATLPKSENTKLLAGLAVSCLCLINAVRAQQYVENIEDRTDRVARVGSVVTLLVGWMKLHGVLSTTATDIILTTTSALVCVWFIFVLGPRRMLQLARECANDQGIEVWLVRVNCENPKLATSPGQDSRT